MSAHIEGPELLTRAEVARLFGVDVRTVSHWAYSGKLSSIRTPGGWRRYLRAEVEALLAGQPLTPAQLEAAWAAHRNGVTR